MRPGRITRRNFVGTVGAVAGAASMGIRASAAPASERVRFGLIGAGSRGNQPRGLAQLLPVAGRVGHRLRDAVRRADEPGARTGVFGQLADGLMGGRGRVQRRTENDL